MDETTPTITIDGRREIEGRWNFDVTITDQEGTMQYTVALDKSYWEKLTDKNGEPEDLIKKSFSFLLERESKDSILRKFNLWEINEYFPEYEEEIRKVM